MELKVWVEGGPQRVVCGVTEATTCEDVVYALAHATAQSGRFALVERWGHTERSLAPSDRPLRLLARRGDVRFLLRRCPPRKTEHITRKPTDGRPLRPPPYDEAVTRSGQRYQPSHKESPGDSPTSKRRLVEGSPQQQYRDLVRLVSLQRERLRSQQEELTHCDSELSYWEARLGTREELSRLERLYQGGRSEMERLQGDGEEALCSELTLARSQLAHCEARLLHCQQRLRQLCQEVAEEKRREEDAVLEERKLLLQRLSQELREANLLALSLADAEHKHWLESTGGFSNRPGSTRKIMGSPRQLENAVPTNKNPNGVWV
ncbi:ras association domain-containing protein 8-like [Ornithodoros turicata]|uniref:Putative signal transduction n=1 Tax=Ornithodoros turicata TaxID=34597 RepID=A0A2R5LJ09_9ACAR